MATVTEATNKTVLCIGIKVNQDLDQRIHAIMTREAAKAKEAGFDFHTFLADPQLTNIAMLKGKLQSQHWDGVTIGFGLRGREEHTELFTRLVNTCVQEANPSPLFAFPLKPDSATEACKALFAPT